MVVISKVGKGNLHLGSFLHEEAVYIQKADFGITIYVLVLHWASRISGLRCASWSVISSFRCRRLAIWFSKQFYGKYTCRKGLRNSLQFVQCFSLFRKHKSACPLSSWSKMSSDETQRSVLISSSRYIKVAGTDWICHLWEFHISGLGTVRCVFDKIKNKLILMAVAYLYKS